MHKLMFITNGYRYQAPEGTGGGGDNPPVQDPPNTDPDKTQDPPKTDPDKKAEPEPKETPKDPDKKAEPEPKKEPGKTHSLFDDDNPETKDPEKVEISDEDKQKFTEEVKKIDLGEGVTFDDAAMEAMAPALMELTGGDPKKAEGAIKAYTEFRKAEAVKAQEAKDAYCDGLIEECKKRWPGGDLKKVVGLAKKGGEAFFGEKIWNEMKKVPEFLNNPDILERFADYGRRIDTDKGKVNPKDGQPSGTDSDVFHRMYGNVKV